MKQKVLLVLMFSLCWAMTMKAQRQELTSGVYWDIKDDVLIISGNGSMGSRSKGSEYPWYVKDFNKIIIENGITDIGAQAFMYNSNIESVEIGNSVKTIKEKAFYHCDKLISIKMGNSVKRIEDWAFGFCKSLRSIIIPNSVTSIGDLAFCNCSNLESVVLPNNISSIENGSFYECNNLQSVTPESMVTTWENVFDVFSCPRLLTKRLITGPNDIKYYIVSKDKKYGLTTFDGKEIVAIEVDYLAQAGKGYLKFELNGYWGIMNYRGKIIIPTSRGYTSIGDFVTFSKRFPYTMTGYKGECDMNGRQVSMIKVETPQQTVTTQTTPTTTPQRQEEQNNNSNNNPGGGTTTVIVEQHGPVQVWVPCGGCSMEPGRCTYCHGSGWGYNDRLCSRCGGSGKCTICNGNGGQYR